jgi:hypothetical protein
LGVIGKQSITFKRASTVEMGAVQATFVEKKSKSLGGILAQNTLIQRATDAGYRTHKA